MPQPHRGDRRAFTLIELLVVISIIALLIGILIPALSGARQASRSLLCRTRLHELTKGASMYAVDSGTFPPCIDNYSASGMDTNQVGLDWLGIGNQFGGFVPGTPNNPLTGNPRGFVDAPKWGLLWKYSTRDADIILCPSDVAGPHQPNEMVGNGNGKFSYTMVSVMGLRVPERIPAASHVSGTARSPSIAPLFVEEHPDGANNMHREGNFGAGDGPNPPPNGGDTLVSRHGPFTARRGIRPGQGAITTFDQGSCNVGFADGHAENLKPNFGFGQTHAVQAGHDTIPNNIVGLLYQAGIAFDVARFP